MRSVVTFLERVLARTDVNKVICRDVEGGGTLSNSQVEHSALFPRRDMF